MAPYLDGDQPLRAAHALTEAVEQAVDKTLPGADVTVHPEPAPVAAKPSPDQAGPFPG